MVIKFSRQARGPIQAVSQGAACFPTRKRQNFGALRSFAGLSCLLLLVLDLSEWPAYNCLTVSASRVDVLGLMRSAPLQCGQVVFPKPAAPVVVRGSTKLEDAARAAGGRCQSILLNDVADFCESQGGGSFNEMRVSQNNSGAPFWLSGKARSKPPAFRVPYSEKHC